jgi:phosphoribulokinase
MKPIDFRNETFHSLEARMEGDRMQCYNVWLNHPNCTTREAARLSGLDILTFRPRTTELCQLGFVVLSDTQDAKGEGRYRARTWAEAADWFERERTAATANQLQLC